MSNRMDSPKRLLLHMLVISLFCGILPGPAMAQLSNEGALLSKTRTELSTVSFGRTFEKYDNLPIVASIDNPGNNRYEIIEFTLEKIRQWNQVALQVFPG